jgi:heptosyltransferase-1
VFESYIAKNRPTMEKTEDNQTGAIKRVLIVKTSSLGDLIHALPAVHALRIGLPATIDWVVNTEYTELAACFTDVRRIIPFPRRAPKQLTAFRRALQAEAYDLAIDLQGLLKSALITRAARATRRIGPSFQREGTRWLYHALAGPPNLKRHAVEQNLDIVRYLKLPQTAPTFPMRFDRPALDTPGPRVALIPCSRWPSKNWPLSAFAQTAQELHNRTQATVYILGSQADAGACENLARELPGFAVNLAGRLTLPELGGHLQAMQLVISNDSGPMHIAAALGVPVLAVFGPTDPERTGPYGTGHQVFSAQLPCRPCYRRHCRYDITRCQQDVLPVQVAAAALEILTSS